jgi:hypothetical protein
MTSDSGKKFIDPSIVRAEQQENAPWAFNTDQFIDAAESKKKIELINLETGDDKMKLFKDLRAKAEGSFGVIKQICRTLP